MCQLLFHLNKNWNIKTFEQAPQSTIPWKSVQGLELNKQYVIIQSTLG